MDTLTFRDYLSILTEDNAAEINKIMADISAIDQQINQRTQPLMARKTALQKMLMLKQKQQEVENNRNPQQQQMAAQAQPGQPQLQQSNQTVQPGSTGSATPGASTPR